MTTVGELRCDARLDGVRPFEAHEFRMNFRASSIFNQRPKAVRRKANANTRPRQRTKNDSK